MDPNESLQSENLGTIPFMFPEDTKNNEISIIKKMDISRSNESSSKNMPNYRFYNLQSNIDSIKNIKHRKSPFPTPKESVREGNSIKKMGDKYIGSNLHMCLEKQVRVKPFNKPQRTDELKSIVMGK